MKAEGAASVQDLMPAADNSITSKQEMCVHATGEELTHCTPVCRPRCRPTEQTLGSGHGPTLCGKFPERSTRTVCSQCKPPRPAPGIQSL
jgi:hypothetical protein